MKSETRIHPGLNLGVHHGETHAQSETLVFGFWVFLMSDLIIFGLMFATYVTTLNPVSMAGGPGPGQLFDLKSAFAPTLLLLTSSVTFGMASLAMRHEATRRRIAGWLVVTLVLGLAFLALEMRDFASMVSQGTGPDRSGYLSAFAGWRRSWFSSGISFT